MSGIACREVGSSAGKVVGGLVGESGAGLGLDPAQHAFVMLENHMRQLRMLAAYLLLLQACSFFTPSHSGGLIPVSGGSNPIQDDAGQYVTPGSILGGLTLEYGDTVHGELAMNECHHWSFIAAAGDEVSLSLSSEEFDPFLALFGADGTFVASNDDGGEGNASLIEKVVLPATGVYVAAVQGYAGSGTGIYALNLELSATRLTSEERGGGILTIGETVYGNLQDWRGEGWIFSSQAGDPVTISLRSREFDAYLELYGPDWMRLYSDDDSGDGANALIDGHVLPSSGTFTIVVRGYGLNDVGAYTLSLD